MQIWHRHSQYILAHYQHEVPLHHFLKNYFKKHPILGSRDRRAISAMVYAWYRASKGFDATDLEVEKWQWSLLLTQNDEKLLAKIFPEASFSITAEKEKAQAQFKTQLLMDDALVVSDGIDRKSWLNSLLHQPHLFVRIRPAFVERSKKLLAHTDAQWVGQECVRFPNGAKVETMLPQDHYVVQDWASQQALLDVSFEQGRTVWDCCSGAGGKALWLREHHLVDLIVSDVRISVLQNLKARFRQYQLLQPLSISLDLEDENLLKQKLGNRKFDYIVADVPCSGSGTWARTPEDAYFFQASQLVTFTQRQQRILRNVLPYLKQGGQLVYITCSVFKAENEEQVAQLAEEGFKVENAQLIQGLTHHADSMYRAVLLKL